MISTELQDIMFGTPVPVRAVVNLGVLSEDEVNIIIHGHEPILSEAMAIVSELIEAAKKVGAKGINLAGVCCTGNEVLMRHGIPIAGSFIQQEIVLATGAVEAMVVDVQCVMQSLPVVAGCFHTEVLPIELRFPVQNILRFIIIMLWNQLKRSFSEQLTDIRKEERSISRKTRWMLLRASVMRPLIIC